MQNNSYNDDGIKDGIDNDNDQNQKQSVLWESPPKLKQGPLTPSYHIGDASPPPPPPPHTTTHSFSSLRHGMSTSSSSSSSSPPLTIDNGRHSDCVNATMEKNISHGQSHLNEQQQQQQQQLPSILFDKTTDGTNNHDNTNNMLLLQKFWRTYDTLIILSICSIVGIVFRMLSAKWFRLEMGSVFSEDSALGTNLPLNVWSCFLMGLLCSGR